MDVSWKCWAWVARQSIFVLLAAVEIVEDDREPPVGIGSKGNRQSLRLRPSPSVSAGTCPHTSPSLPAPDTLATIAQ